MPARVAAITDSFFGFACAHYKVASRVWPEPTSVLAVDDAATSGGTDNRGAALKSRKASLPLYSLAEITKQGPRERQLNGWQRMGVVASVVWFPVGFFYGSGQAIDSATAMVSFRLRMCFDRPAAEYAACNATFSKDWAAAVEGSHRWAWAFAFAIVPIVLARLLIWGLVAIVRWVAAGGFKTA
jgi:hypothetical protein